MSRLFTPFCTNQLITLYLLSHHSPSVSLSLQAQTHLFHKSFLQQIADSSRTAFPESVGLIKPGTSLVLCLFFLYIIFSFLPRDALQCKARYCDRMQSVCLSVTLVDCDHIGWNSSEIISPLLSLWDVRSLQPQHDGSAPRGTPLKFGPKVTHPLLI